MVNAQAEPLKVAGDDDGIDTVLHICVVLGAGDAAGGGAISPVDGNIGSADG